MTGSVSYQQQRIRCAKELPLQHQRFARVARALLAWLLDGPTTGKTRSKYIATSIRPTHGNTRPTAIGARASRAAPSHRPRRPRARSGQSARPGQAQREPRLRERAEREARERAEREARDARERMRNRRPPMKQTPPVCGRGSDSRRPQEGMAAKDAKASPRPISRARAAPPRRDRQEHQFRLPAHAQASRLAVADAAPAGSGGVSGRAEPADGPSPQTGRSARRDMFTP